MFAKDSFFFFSYQSITTIFMIVNKELDKAEERIKANKLSLNIEKQQIFN